MKPTFTIVTATGSYTSPVGCKYLKVFVIGPGGGGGGRDNNRGGGPRPERRG